MIILDNKISMNLHEYIKKTVKECLNENVQDIDYSGEYSDLYNFIYDNDLEKKFVEKYNKFDSDLTIENWEEFVHGEMGTDEEIIKDFIGNEYKIYYDSDIDTFIITKNKKNKLKYKIILSNSKDIIKVLENSGVYSEYEPRFAVLLNNKIIGGLTYYIDSNNVYNFDIGILKEYQGYGISKKLIDFLILDAKKMNADLIKAQIVNNMLFDYLIKIGFESSIDDGIKYVYKNI